MNFNILRRLVVPPFAFGLRQLLVFLLLFGFCGATFKVSFNVSLSARPSVNLLLFTVFYLCFRFYFYWLFVFYSHFSCTAQAFFYA